MPSRLGPKGLAALQIEEPVDSTEDVDVAASLPAGALAVPIVSQETDYSCGAAALLAALRYWQVDEDLEERDLYDLLGTDEDDGTSPEAIAAVANDFGLQANWRDDVKTPELLDALKAGLTVVLDLQAWGGGHYVVLVGEGEGNLYFMDPSTLDRYTYLPIEEFESRWYDTAVEEDDEDGLSQRGAVFIEGKAALEGEPETTDAEMMG